MKFTGLTEGQAAEKFDEYGPNEIADLFHVSLFRILFRQVKKNFIVYLLAVAAIASLAVGKDVTGYAILVIILLIVATGFLQEYKAEKAIKALKQMIMPMTVVVRDGQETEIPSRNLVPGDIVILRTGEKVPADCLVLQETSLRLDESILTGESRDVEKKTGTKASLQKENKIFMGTHLTSGKCVAEVLHTGMNTEFGRIASLISGAEKELPLQDKVNKIAQVMVLIALTVSFSTGLIMSLRSLPLTVDVLVDIMIVVIALSVSAFPEGLPVVLMSALAGGAYSMAKENAIVNRMSIIETLGETTVICSDKTGTITTGEMTVRKIFADGKEYEVSGVGYKTEGQFTQQNTTINPNHNDALLEFLKASVICNDSRIERTGEDHQHRLIGTPTEGALLVMAAKGGVFKNDLDFERIEEIPFSSERKMMSVVVKINEQPFVFSKGAPEVLLAKCTHYRHEGRDVKLTPEALEDLRQYQSDLSRKRYRVIAVALKHQKGHSDIESGLTLLGLLGIEDPPREEVKEALAACHKAGIAVKMITGDNKETALQVGKEIGLEGGVLTGPELDEMTDSELKTIIKHIAIFARVRPEHKIRIVKAFKDKGEIVTMTGDGVNDAPALKEAHIGVAMGKNGTDVSREASDLVLKDDNFSTIVSAVRAGRVIFNNIQKFITLQLSLNSAELFIIFIGIVLNLPLPLLAIHILFLNMVTDNMSALSLAFNPSSTDVMSQKPRKKASIFTREMLLMILVAGGIIGSISLGIFYVTLELSGNLSLARTNALVVLIFLEIANAFNFRSFRKPVYSTSLFRNKYLVYASTLSVIFTVIVVNTGVNRVFELTPLHPLNWLGLFVASLTIIAVFDLWKLKRNRSSRKLPA